MSSSAPPSLDPAEPSGAEGADAPAASSASPPPASFRSPHTLVLRGNLQRDLFRLGVVPCAAVALALTGWFTHNRLQTLEAAWVTARQIEAGRVAASHFLRREGRLFIRIFPHKPVSGKPLETRMGKGKGEPEFWCAVVKPGTVMFEVSGVDEATAKRALARVAHKMPVQTRFLARRLAVA